VAEWEKTTEGCEEGCGMGWDGMEERDGSISWKRKKEGVGIRVEVQWENVSLFFVLLIHSTVVSFSLSFFRCFFFGAFFLGFVRSSSVCSYFHFLAA